MPIPIGPVREVFHELMTAHGHRVDDGRGGMQLTDRLSIRLVEGTGQPPEVQIAMAGGPSGEFAQALVDLVNARGGQASYSVRRMPSDGMRGIRPWWSTASMSPVDFRRIMPDLERFLTEAEQRGPGRRHDVPGACGSAKGNGQRIPGCPP